MFVMFSRLCIMVLGVQIPTDYGHAWTADHSCTSNIDLNADVVMAKFINTAPFLFLFFMY